MRTAANVFSFFFLLLWLAIPGLGQSPQVDIEVNQTHGLNDDYLTWAPTKCRAKITGAGDTTGATMIELHSHSLPVAADQPAGAVSFALEQSPWPVDTTASQATIQLNLPHDGSWVPFIVAGKFGHQSTNDKDCSIEANVVGSSDVVGHCKVMVRVRKNGNDLHAVEKSRYVAAMRGFRDRLMNGYLSIEEMHRLAAAGGHHDEAEAFARRTPSHDSVLRFRPDHPRSERGGTKYLEPSNAFANVHSCNVAGLPSVRGADGQE